MHWSASASKRCANEEHTFVGCILLNSNGDVDVAPDHGKESEPGVEKSPWPHINRLGKTSDLTG